MADWYDHIDEERKAFIERQHMFFGIDGSFG